MQNEIQRIKGEIIEWKKILYRASQMRNARQVIKVTRTLDRLYRKLDKLQK